uniref:cytosolic carboxypeptidase 2-like isoform X1 n=1 Tax=Ciona intestinalis TaxID=7719 RepID=UPI000EF4B2A0|nr:cytosolic carboxypeptidase 2-like isoform X1 [Ciona intestinalis]|eukprot:XP_026695395.1 cytosolic carboxypeptidase 2-like isoform X1 [Ciona intestinalis]
MDNILHTEFDSTGDVTDLNDGEIFEEKSSEGLAAAVPKPLWIFGPKFSWYPTSKSPKSRKKIKKKKSSIDRTVNPYDNFMKRHLQHYGYYTGRNASFRDNFRSLQEWRRNYDARLSGYHDLSVPDEQFGKNGQIIEGPLFSSEGQLPDDLLHRTTQLVFHYQAGRKIPKLREPRNLYALTKEAGPQQATRWPSHMQVVCPAIRFLEYNPPIPDPLYKHTGKEPTPAVRGPQLGEMIYYNDPGRDLYFMRSRVAGCRLAMVSTTLTPREYPEDNLTLEFESRFESGNLLKVDKLSDFEYELTLRTDLYTNKHTQWFFFRVRNMRPEQTYRFTIVNLMKPSSLYNHGMRPVFYSEMNAKKNKVMVVV